MNEINIRKATIANDKAIKFYKAHGAKDINITLEKEL